MNEPPNEADTFAPPPAVAPARVDAWVWACRLAPTRSAATATLSAGRVRVNGVVVKPAKKIVPGDLVEVRSARVTKVFRVVATITKRVGAPVAARCYEVVDEEWHRAPPGAPVAAWGERQRGTGRPTKRERRQTDRWKADHR